MLLQIFTPFTPTLKTNLRKTLLQLFNYNELYISKA